MIFSICNIFTPKKVVNVKTYTEKEFLNTKLTLQNYKTITSNDFFICDNIYKYKANDNLSENEKQLITEMANYYCNCNQKAMYKKTEYLCDYDNKICLHNRYAKIMNKYQIANDTNNSIIEIGEQFQKDTTYVAFLYGINNAK